MRCCGHKCGQIAVLLFLSLVDAGAWDFAGPPQLQDTFLPSQLRYQSYPESARVLNRDDWQAGVNVDWTADLAKTDTYLFDGESVTTTLRVRYAPFDRLEFGIDVPYAVRIDGGLDEFIEFAETTLNQKVLARYQLPRDTYQAFIGTTNEAQLLLKKTSGFRDITLRAKCQLFQHEDHWLDAAVVGTLALPTGESSLGGEGFSPGVGLHLQKPFERFNLFAGAAATYYTDAAMQRFRFNHWRAMGYGGFEIRPWKYCATVLEYQIYSPFAPENEPLSEVSQYWTWTVFRLYFGKVVFDAGIVENSFFGLLENRNGSDVVFKASLTGTF